MATRSNGNIYRDVNSLEDIRRINRRIRREMGGIRRRDQLTELKKRSDYLCALTRAPSWRKKFGRKSSRMLSVAKTEDVRTTKRANEAPSGETGTSNTIPGGSDQHALPNHKAARRADRIIVRARV